jgi:central kinetochore subunit Mal2/MCM21
MPKSTDPDDNSPLHGAISSNSQKQLTYNQECLYRICSGVTTFKVKDPDPYSTNKGAVLGIRIEAFQNGRFIRPYYVFLNRHHLDNNAWRVHRHTVPPCIPLDALVNRYLPAPTQSGDALKVPKQALPRFVKALRSHAVAYHNRIAVIGGMRRSFGLDASKGGEKEKRRELTLSDVSAADAEARQIRMEWMDGRIGRAVVNSKGTVIKCVVIGDEGRDRTTERTVLGGDGRIDGMTGRLLE